MSHPLEQFDLVLVPFQFTDTPVTQRRPALVLSDGTTFNQSIDRNVMAMITTATTAPWPLDVAIQNLALTGLQTPSIVRMKLFKLDHSLVIKKIGKLADHDAGAVGDTLQQLFKFSQP